MTVQLSQYIERRPGVRGGKPCIVGRRITIADIATDYLKLGYLPEQIASTYDLSLAKVHAALAFYYDHRQEIDGQLKEDEGFINTLQQGYPSHLKHKLQSDSQFCNPLP